MAVKIGKDVALGCDKNIFQEMWGSDEAREDGSVPMVWRVGLCLVFVLRLSLGANLDRFGEGKC